MSDANRPWEPHYRAARFLRATLAKLVLAAFRTRAIDIDRVPMHGGAILAGNHVSYADPVLLWCKSPRPCHFMAKAQLFETSVIGWGLPRLWAFPVRRGEADRAAISKATEYLKAGDLVGIFPEGTRTRDNDGELGAAHQGVAFIALRAGVPIIPVGIAGTDRIRPEGSHMLRFPQVTMCFGEPITAEDFSSLDKRERLQAMTAAVMDSIGAQLERARRS